MLPAFLSSVSIERGFVPARLDVARAAGVLWEASSSTLQLEVPDVARLRITRDAIVIAPLVDDALDRLGPFLRRTPLMALTLLRGGLACNAAAIAGPSGAILLVGAASCGKSSLAAALIARGGRLLADDAAPVMLDVEGAVVQPVWPELALWPDAVAAIFGADRPGWCTPAPSMGFGAPLWSVAAERFQPGPMRIIAIYRLLRDSLVRDLEHRATRGAQLFAANALMPLQPRIAEAMIDPTALLHLYGAVAASARVADVRLPGSHLAEVERLADRIVKECGWSGSI